MDKTILIAGKEVPVGKDLASSAVLHGRTVFITAESDATDTGLADGSNPVAWNKGSALSSRSLLISASNKNGHLDEAVLILDEEYFAPNYFDYLIIDEFHHAVNDQYKRIVEYFKPQFLLGLTATATQASKR